MTTCDPSSHEHLEVYARIHEAVFEQAHQAAIPQPKAAFTGLLRGRSVYSVDGAGGMNLAFYSTPHRVSLPASVADAPQLASLVEGTVAAQFYEYGDVERMLRPQTELDADPCEVTPFWDPVRRRSRKKLVGFYRHLLRIGLVFLAPCDTALEQLGVGCFFDVFWTHGESTGDLPLLRGWSYVLRKDCPGSR